MKNRKYNYKRLSNESVLRILNYHQKQQGQMLLRKKIKGNFGSSKHEYDRSLKMKALFEEVEKRNLTYRMNKTYATALVYRWNTSQAKKRVHKNIHQSRYTKKSRLYV